MKAKHLARWIITESGKGGRSNLEIQKTMWVLELVWRFQKKEPLIDGKFEFWWVRDGEKMGVIIRDVWLKYLPYGADSVWDKPLALEEKLKIGFSREDIALLDRMIFNLSQIPYYKLVALMWRANGIVKNRVDSGKIKKPIKDYELEKEAEEIMGDKKFLDLGDFMR